MRIALGLEYLGSHFCGWQFQPHARTVQGDIETALSQVANHPVKVICAGRTDTGVHALGQVIHAEVIAQRSPRSWILGSNSYLPQDISVLWVHPVDETFHARFSVVERHYCYIILNRMSRPALFTDRATWEHRPLDEELMQWAANDLLGTHDFTSYRSSACQAKNPIRTINHLSISRKDEWVILEISANAFLHHMVRNIAGVLMAIGRGEHPPQWAKTILEAKDRKVGGVTAPAGGLYLSQVDYPEHYGLPNKSFGKNLGLIMHLAPGRPSS